MSTQTSRVEIPFGAEKLIIETGKLAKQANGAVTVTCGGTMVMVTACMSRKPRTDIDFFPLMVEYQEKMYAAGKVPGGFFKREGRPTQKEILTARCIDRPIRPLFPDGFFNDVQVTALVLSSDGENDPDILATIGASAALTISSIPFDGPIGAVRVGLLDDKLVANPTYEERENSILDLMLVGHADGIVMIEGEGLEVPEAKIIEALKFAEEYIQSSRQGQLDLQKEVGKEKATVEVIKAHPDLKGKVEGIALEPFKKAYEIADKSEREEAQAVVAESVLGDMSIYDDLKVDDQEVKSSDVKAILEEMEYDIVRKQVFEQDKRADGRGCKEMRELISEINVLPRTHGSALFTRGQTQSLAVVTLGTKRDEQMLEGLRDTVWNNFMLHYNFPSFSVGEARPSRGPGRREIGHGMLALKSLKGVLPSKDDFPYTIRIVSEILESNGSSSMASVCAGCLSMMAAGVPIKGMVAGISIGLMTEGDDYRILTDIMGLEDHFGDMDYKISGTEKGVTAIQLDLKINGLPLKILEEGLEQAREARLQILENMKATIDKPVDDISQFAPRIVTMMIEPEKIGEVIGPGGKMIKRIIEETGCESIDIEDDGKILIASLSKEASEKALAFIGGLTEAPEVGKIYDAVVAKVTNFGAFCEFLPGKQGLVHVSELAEGFVKDVESVVKVGDKFKVKLVEIDKMKRMNLSKKQAEEKVSVE